MVISGISQLKLTPNFAHGYVKRFALWCMKYLVNYGKNWNLIQKYFIMNIRVCEEIFLRGIVLIGNGKINW